MSFLGTTQPEMVQATWATPFGTPFFHVNEDGQYVKHTMEELREQYQAWERILYAMRNLSHTPVKVQAFLVEEELFPEKTDINEDGIVSKDSRSVEQEVGNGSVEVSGCTPAEPKSVGLGSVKGDNEAIDLVATSNDREVSCIPAATDNYSIIGTDLLKRSFGWKRPTDGKSDDLAEKKVQVAEELEDEDEDDEREVVAYLLSDVKNEEESAKTTNIEGILKTSTANLETQKSADVAGETRRDHGENKKSTAPSVKKRGLFASRLDTNQKRNSREKKGLRPVGNIVF